MNINALTLNSVSKNYKSYSSFSLQLLTWFGFEIKPSSNFHALRDVDLDLKKGESLGIIGRNGAGKSTLLKLITGTAAPTSGTICVNGSINSILELGLGFNQELTGRENVIISAGMMGIPPNRISELLPQIEDFAEIGTHFDAPVRTYSSGMQARLAFSVATANQPDILIIDEVLSVGDSYFQHKCFAKIKSFTKTGSSLILVTHSMADVKALCDNVLLLDKGKTVKYGKPDEVVDYYNALIAEQENRNLTSEQRRNKDGWLVTKHGTGEAVVERLILCDQRTREPVQLVVVNQKLTIKTDVRVISKIEKLVLGFAIKDRSGHLIWGTNTWYTDQVIENLDAGSNVMFCMEFTCTLGPGSYSLSPSLVSTETHLVDNYEWTENALIFDVVNSKEVYFQGCNWIDAKFSIEKGN